MNETIDLLKFAVENASPIVIFICCVVFIGYKARSILYFSLEMKDLARKRLIQKHEEYIKFDKDIFSTPLLQDNYKRLCEQSQIQALIGCSLCTPQIAAYILSRKDIINTIRKYHRIRSEITINGVDLVPKVKMGKFRIWFNVAMGFVFYMILAMSAFLPLFIPALNSIYDQPLTLNFDWKIIIGLFFYTITSMIFALIILNESLKPKLAKEFCNLPRYVKVTKYTYICKKKLSHSDAYSLIFIQKYSQ